MTDKPNGAFVYDPERKKAKVRVYAGLDPVTGKQRVRSKTWSSPNVTTAKRESHGIIDKIQREAEEAREAAGTVGGYALEWEATMVAERKSPATLYRMRSIVQAIVDDLGHRKLDELTVRDVERWYTHLRTENVAQGSGVPRYRSESTVHHYYRILSQVLEAAERQDLIRAAPTRKAKKPGRTKPKPRPPETADLLALIASAPPAVALAAGLAAQLGLRRGELMGLRWSDITNGVVHVERSVTDIPGKPVEFKKPKTDASVRDIKLHDESARALMAWHDHLSAAAELAPDAVIFPDLVADPSGRVPKRPGWLSAAWASHCRAQGVRVRFHDARHWAATNMVLAGVAITDVAAQIGHSRTSTTLDMYSGSSRSIDGAARTLGPLLYPEIAPPPS